LASRAAFFLTTTTRFRRQPRQRPAGLSTVLRRPWELTRQDLRQLKLALDQRGLSETTLAPEREAAGHG
jgi:type I restriction enzyme R subunit